MQYDEYYQIDTRTREGAAKQRGWDRGRGILTTTAAAEKAAAAYYPTNKNLAALCAYMVLAGADAAYAADRLLTRVMAETKRGTENHSAGASFANRSHAEAYGRALADSGDYSTVYIVDHDGEWTPVEQTA